MALESCMILLDQSAYMRNGDYVPTRLESQHDAANMLVGAKLQNPESTVGALAGTRLLASPTTNIGTLLQSLHQLNGSGNDLEENPTDLPSAVQIASLALKHRRNKAGAQRIVAFVGSPVTAEVKALQKAGKQLKKNNISIDIVALGEIEDNEEKLQQLINAANGRSDDGAERTCHLVTVPAGVLASDVLASSPILGGSGAMHGGMGGGGGGDDANIFAEYGGVDPSMDPELAMALRVSMEEERARQERLAAAQQQESNESQPAAAAANAAPEMDEEEALLQQALAMSMNENEPTSSDNNNNEASGGGGGVKSSAGTQTDAMQVDTEMDEDAAMQMALQMSMQQESAGGGAGGSDNIDTAMSTDSAPNDQQQQESFQDPAFVQELLGGMPGVDPNDPEVQEALRKAAEAEKDKKNEKK